MKIALISLLIALFLLLRKQGSRKEAEESPSRQSTPPLPVKKVAKKNVDVELLPPLLQEEEPKKKSVQPRSRLARMMLAKVILERRE